MGTSSFLIPCSLYDCGAQIELEGCNGSSSVVSTGLKQKCHYCDTDTCFFDCDGSRGDVDGVEDDVAVIARQKHNGFIDGLESLLLTLVGAGYSFNPNSREVSVVLNTLTSAYRTFVDPDGDTLPEYPVLRETLSDNASLSDASGQQVLATIVFFQENGIERGFKIVLGVEDVGNRDIIAQPTYALPMQIHEPCLYCDSVTCDGECMPAAGADSETLGERLAFNAAIDALLVFTAYWVRAELPVDDTYINAVKSAHQSIVDLMT